MAYHITENGPRKCAARDASWCPYSQAIEGSQYSAHVEDLQEADKLYEKTMEEIYSPNAPLSKKPKIFKNEKVKQSEQVSELARAIRVVNMGRENQRARRAMNGH